MTFGKRGRPAEDRIGRRNEIYEAVGPLIMSAGCRKLSMRDAAHAACLSIGGLYHYFPNKRELALHGLTDDARARKCQAYRESLANLAAWDLESYVDAYLANSMQLFSFVRPSIHAALEIGSGELQARLDAGLATNVAELVETLRQLAPDLDDAGLADLARAIRRLALGALIDANSNLDELERQMRALVRAYTAHQKSGVALGG